MVSMQTHNLSSLWSVPLGSRVHQISSSSDGSQIAIGTAQASVVLDGRTGGLESTCGDEPGPVTAVGFTASGQLLVGSRGSIRLREPGSGSVLASLELSPPDDDADTGEDAVFIARQPAGELLGIASSHGRKVFVVDHDLRVLCEMELQPKLGNLTELTWLSQTALLATSNGGIQGWSYTHGSGKSSLMLGRSIGIVAASPSPDHSTLAAGSRDGVVYLWSIAEDDSQPGEEALFPDLRSTLKDYNDEVHLLRWDTTGRYLATADGSEVTIWDVPKLFEQPVQSNICCGHDSNTRILCAAFQDDGPVLATGGSDGKVLFYNSTTFSPGQVSQPCASAPGSPAGDAITCLAWLPGGQLVAGTESGQLLGWRLQPAAVEDSPGSESALEMTQVEQQPEAAAAPSPRESHEAGMNGFAKRPPAQKLVPKAGRAPLETASSSSSSLSTRQSRAARSLARNNSSGSLAVERTSSLHNSRGLREHLRSNDFSAPGEQGGVHIGEAGRSVSLQEGAVAHRRAGSLERQQLSPSLMQHIQRVQQKPAATHRQREPAGWGMGSSAPSAPGWQVPYAAPNGVIPFNPGTPAAGGPMQPGFMMFPGQAPGMGPQGMMPAYGFPPTMTPVPMVPQSPQQQQGIMSAKSLPAMQPGMQPGMPPNMMYMPVGAPGMPQQWPMMQGPWMGQYFVHPSQRPPEQMAVASAGRSSSAPDAPAPYNWSPRPHPQGSQGDARESLSKNAISLPAGMSAEWRAQQASQQQQQPQAGEKPQSTAADLPAPAALKRRSSGIDAPKPAPVLPTSPSPAPPPAPAPPKEEKDAREPAEPIADRQPAKPPPPSSPRPQPAAAAEPDPEDGEPGTIDSSNPVVTVYVGNLPPTVDEVALMLPFSYFGSITNIQVIRDKNSLQSRGFAFVSYSQPVFATSAIQNMNGRIMFGSFRGRALKVGPSNRVI